MRIVKIASILLIATAPCLAALTKTTTTISSSLNPSTYGQAVTFTAVVSPQPPNGETITFSEGSTILATGTLANGTASFTTSALTVSLQDDVKASYPGDSTYASSSSSAVDQVVKQASTTTALLSSGNPANSGQLITFTAAVAPQYGGTVTGNVWFYNGSTKLVSVTVSSNAANYTTSKLAVGTDEITAVYEGSKSFAVSTSNAISQSVENGATLNPTMTWDGVTRYYQVYVPAVLPQNPPLLLMLHGTHYDVPPANPSTMNWQWQSVANQYQFIEVQPASTYNQNSGQWNWNDYFMEAAFTADEIGTCTSPPASSCPDDAGFLRQLITNLISQYNINPNMVFVTGMSSGAQMTQRVGVELSDLVAAIAPASGQMEGQQSVPPPVLGPGNALAPISVQEWHGTADPVLPPCDYGRTLYSGVTYYLDTVDDTFNYWVGQNKCSTLQTTQTLCTDGQATPGLSGNVASGCTNNVEVQFIWEQGVGHNYETSNNTSRWLFLAAHPKPSNSVRKSMRRARAEN
jgi:poly(hydroxyalkanoate) depolymerase family esterase